MLPWRAGIKPLPVSAWTYGIQVFESIEDGGFIAKVLVFPGCVAFGITREDALTELGDAMRAWIEAMQAAGNPIPAPNEEILDEEPRMHWPPVK
jgi:predicted RNase H-like HicB family nuclease